MCWAVSVDGLGVGSVPRSLRLCLKAVVLGLQCMLLWVGCPPRYSPLVGAELLPSGMTAFMASLVLWLKEALSTREA